MVASFTSGRGYPPSEGIIQHSVGMVREPNLCIDVAALGHWFVLLSRIRPDVVSIGTPKAALLGLFASFCLGIPARVYFLRGLRLEGFRGPRRFLMWVIEKITAQVSTEIIAVSASLKTEYLKNRLSSGDKITVLGAGSSIGVDLSRFRPPEDTEVTSLENLADSIGLRPETPVIGLVGRHSIDKGLQVFFSATTALARDGCNFQVLLIGPDESKGALSNFRSAASFHSVALGEQDDIAPYYRIMTLLAHPTLREGMPNVVLEALASGVPVVTTDATGATDSIEHDVVGIKIPMNSSPDLQTALSRLLDDQALHSRLKTRARGWVSERFSKEAVASYQVQHYLQLVTHHRQE